MSSLFVITTASVIVVAAVTARGVMQVQEPRGRLVNKELRVSKNDHHNVHKRERQHVDDKLRRRDVRQLQLVLEFLQYFLFHHTLERCCFAKALLAA